jgi:NhaP-type Na+/H+ or K+/H+ antiporter
MGNEVFVSIATIIIFSLLIIYIIGGALMEAKKFIIGHETGLCIVLGLLVSLFLKVFQTDNIQPIFNFDEQIFFFLCLPPIIFAAGFNMRRKRFFENIGYVLLFGIVGSIVAFSIFSSLTLGFF